MNNISRSIEAFSKAKELIPGGVNSPVRAFKSVGAIPCLLVRQKAARYGILTETAT